MAEKTTNDDLFQAIGELKGGQEAMLRIVEQTARDMKDNSERVIKAKLDSEAAHKRIDLLVPLVASHEALINKGQGASRAVVWIVGSCASVITFTVGIITAVFWR